MDESYRRAILIQFILVEIVNKFLWIGSTGSTNRDIFLSSRGMDGCYFEIVTVLLLLSKVVWERCFRIVSFFIKKSMPKD